MTLAERTILGHAIALFEALGKKPSIRGIAAVIEAAHGKKAMRWQTIAEALKVLPGNSAGNTPATPGQQIDEERATPRQQSETATCASADLSRVVYDSAQGPNSNSLPPTPSQPETVVLPLVPIQSESPALFAVPEPTVKPIKPVKIISAYAGATLESFDHLVPLVTVVLAVDGHGTNTKAFATSLQTLAMWRALYGDAALAYGLTQAATRQKGHRYAGAIATKYVPDEHRAPLRSVAAVEPADDDDGIPTRLDLVACGLSEPIGPNDIPAHQRPPWHELYRPLVATA